MAVAVDNTGLIVHINIIMTTTGTTVHTADQSCQTNIMTYVRHSESLTNQTKKINQSVKEITPHLARHQYSLMA